MPNEQKLRLNYFVGAALAQGGEVRLDGTKIVFFPTSALDRAMGAKEVEIPYQQIRALEHKGELLRTFNIKTDQKVYKFEGSQAKKLAELLEKNLKESGFMDNIQFDKKSAAPSPQAAPSWAGLSPCKNCSKSLKPDYAFCPSCATPVKPVCKSCHRATEKDWVVCAYCGQKE